MAGRDANELKCRELAQRPEVSDALRHCALPRQEFHMARDLL